MKLIKGLLLTFLVASNFLAWNQQNGFVPGELIIQTKADAAIEQLVRSFQAEYDIQANEIQTLSKVAAIYLVRFENQQIDLNDCTKKLYEYPEVQMVQKNHYVTQRETIPSDTVFTDQWHHKNDGSNGGNLDADVDTPDAWDVTTGGLTAHNDTIVVCVIESVGVDISHVDLVDNIWHNHAEIPDDGIDNDGNGYIDDYNGWNVATLDDAVGSGSHGTRVAGMIGATGDNITGVTGVNWDVKMMIVRGQVASNEATVIAAYDYPLNMRKKYNDTYGQEGAFVVATNASWGLDNGDPDDSPIWCAMYDTLGTYGILNIGATTNSNSNVDVVGDLPTACTSEYLIGVTMTNNQDVRANSGYGPTHVDLAAPGFGVVLPLPGGFYTSTTGTSFAAPCVTGAVALAYSSPCISLVELAKNDPAAAALQMRDFILNNVDVVSNLSGEVGTSGRLNVNNTIQDIMGSCVTSPCETPYHVYASDITDTLATTYWQGFSGEYLVYLQDDYLNQNVYHVTSDSINFDTLQPCLNYQVAIRGICGTDTSDYSPWFDFKTDGCCDNPTLYEDYSSPDTLTVSWQDVLNGTSYDIRIRELGETAWMSTLTDVDSPIIFSALDTCTDYEIQIKTQCADSTQGYSDSQLFKTKGCGACYEADYCEVIGANSNQEWIERVKIGNQLSITGDNGGWYQSDEIITGFFSDNYYDIEVQPGYSGFEFTERISVWVDLNHNGTFEASERLINDQSTNTILIDSIYIPPGIAYGTTKLRIGMSALSNPSQCPSTNFYGEYEDYCVYFGDDASIQEQLIQFYLVPNPANSHVEIISSHTIESVELIDLSGKTVQLSSQSKVNLADLSPGVYLVKISTESGIGVQKLIKE